MKVVGFMGDIGSGKDSCCRILRKYGYFHCGFSDPLYEQLNAINPILYEDVSYLELVKKRGADFVKRSFPEVRRLLRVLGTECGRDIHGEDCWIRALERRTKDCDKVAIQGIRFENECEYVLRHGGLLVWLMRSEQTQEQALAGKEHRSEHLEYQKYAHCFLENAGNLIDLETNLLVLLRSRGFI